MSENNKKINPFVNVDIEFEKDEILKPVLNNVFENIKPYYCVSNKGNVYSMASGEMKKLVPIPYGKETSNNNGRYQNVGLMCETENGTIKKNIAIHRVVALTFNPNGIDKENGIDNIDHIDGNKENNNIENLDWVSREENIYRAVQNGMMNRKLEDAKIAIQFIINDLKENKLTLDQIAEKYGVSRSIIHRLKHGSYKDIVGNVEFEFKKILTDYDVKNIYERSFNEDWNKIAEEYKISWHTVRQIHYANGTRFEERLKNMGFDLTKNESLTPEQIIEIRKKCDAGISDEELAIEYNRSIRTISDIRRAKNRFKDILENAGFITEDVEKELSDIDLFKVYEAAKNGMTDDDIATKYNIHKTTVKSIRTGSKYKYLDFLKRYNLPKIMTRNIIATTKPNRFSEDEAINIYNDMKNNKITATAAAAKYGCDKSLTANIKYCRGSYSYLQEKYGLEPLL